MSRIVENKDKLLEVSCVLHVSNSSNSTIISADSIQTINSSYSLPNLYDSESSKSSSSIESSNETSFNARLRQTPMKTNEVETINFLILSTSLLDNSPISPHVHIFWRHSH